MKCSFVKVDGHPVILCGRTRLAVPCKTCGEIAGLQCDWKIAKGWRDYKPKTDGFSTTCDEYICANCATQVGPNKHLCPTHAEAWKTHPANPHQGELEV